MKYVFTTDTDVGTRKDVNQDSILVKHAKTGSYEVLLAIVCDGVGGLSKGELASATVIRAFSEWFEKELPHELNSLDMQVIGGKWELLIRDLNNQMLAYGQKFGVGLGTTFSGILFINNNYLIGHVGDTRVYYLGNSMYQLTEDHTVIANEIKNGTLSVEQAKTDSRRNMLLQCIGASSVVTPQIIVGMVEPGTYIVCSDGFRHEISEKEIFERLYAGNLTDKQMMHLQTRYLIELVKNRQERDNISVVLIKAT